MSKKNLDIETILYQIKSLAEIKEKEKQEQKPKKMQKTIQQNRNVIDSYLYRVLMQVGAFRNRDSIEPVFQYMDIESIIIQTLSEFYYYITYFPPCF